MINFCHPFFFSIFFFQQAEIKSLLQWNLHAKKNSLCLPSKDQNKPIYAVISYCNTVCFCFTLCKMHYAN